MLFRFHFSHSFFHFLGFLGLSDLNFSLFTFSVFPEVISDFRRSSGVKWRGVKWRGVAWCGDGEMSDRKGKKIVTWLFNVQICHHVSFACQHLLRIGT